MKRIIVIVIFIGLSIGMVSADQSDSLFCLVRKNDVIISLKQTPGYYNCKDTIISLEHLIIGAAKDLINIQAYITKGSDVEYRKSIQTEKKALLDKLQLARITIITDMKTFEDNLFKKSVQYFIIKITPYKISLQKSLVKISALTASGFSTPLLTSYALLLKAQVAVLDSLSKVTTTEELNDLLAKYVYLKKEITGKSE